MVYKILWKNSTNVITAMAFVISGCMPSDIPTSTQGLAQAPVGTTTSGSTSGSSSGTINGLTGLLPKVEIRHLIEPNLSTDANYSSGTGYAGGGSYVRKLTLPKNFQGRLYLAGININAVKDRLVKVRFKFGAGRESVTIPATVAQAPGITPQTDINVLVMDMRGEPFRNVRLPYDLFDYNEYGASENPIQDNRNTGLYCRGLRVEDDPTFNGVGLCDGLQPDEECLYSYAKVLDQGLIKDVGGVYVPLTPTLPQVKSFSGSSFYQDFMGQHLKKSLADNYMGPFKFSELAVPALYTDAVNMDFDLDSDPNVVNLDWTAKNINGSNYYYRGPYRLVNSSEWHFRFSDPVGTKRLFKNFRPYTGLTGPTPINNTVYFGSYMFPLASQLNLTSNVTHLSSADWDAARSENTLSVPGKSLWMDGSNVRANSKNVDLEHIGSCNVSATIEIIAKDENLNEYIIAVSKDVKIQLVRPIQYYTDSGNDVLYTNFKTCASNASCGGNECCFNNRCWDETLVSQCYDSASIQGNKQVGESCLTDMDCSSLCCNRTSGLCSPHNTNSSPQVLCSKPIGDFCIAKEWCQKTPVVKCLIVKTGTNALGEVTCRQQCYTTSEYGDCKAGSCSAPLQEVIPVFNPNAPNACDAAVPAPNF